MIGSAGEAAIRREALILLALTKSKDRKLRRLRLLGATLSAQERTRHGGVHSHPS